MTDLQYQLHLKDRRTMDAFNKQLGLDSMNFNLWYDHRDKELIMYVETYMQDDIEIGEDQLKKVTEQPVICVRKIGGRARVYTQAVWESKVKIKGEIKQRFQLLDHNEIIKQFIL